ncbi:M23 family metallopeptidase [Corynebacterium oculi]|uniref:Peptidase family M23 n=1 Tax=Corynebacterium oculi TaxID=1544416 RepID=A0A0Q0YSH1_9CORY|nr:M23 family metallopeptidase [Corynebacterium oculi]KQB85329.1 Peptidase family M23 [Corynebacterium oculi]
MNAHRTLIALYFLCALTVLFYCPVSPPHASAWVSPTTNGPRPGGIHQAFHAPPHNWLSGHRGVDLTAAPGTPIHAAGSGVVAFVGRIAGSPIVSIDHEQPVRIGKAHATAHLAAGSEVTIRTTYQPVIPRVEQGQRIEEGEVIGHLGGTPAQRHHAASGLHWGARVLPTDDQYLNPLILLPTPVIRLKPLSP